MFENRELKTTLEKIGVSNHNFYCKTKNKELAKKLILNLSKDDLEDLLESLIESSQNYADLLYEQHEKGE
jgi:hypothetical protein